MAMLIGRGFPELAKQWDSPLLTVFSHSLNPLSAS